MRPEFSRTLEFARGAEDIDDPAELNRRFAEVTRPFGVKYFSTIVTGPLGQVLTPRVILGEVDPDWTRHYTERGYAAVDPVLTALFDTRKPFTWREAAERTTNRLARRMFREVTELTGTDNALVVPIHDVPGETAAVVMSGEAVEFDAQVRPILHLAAVYFSGVARDLVDRRPAPEPCPLTARQLECLRWVMDGKSDWEIGEILRISEHTAHNHIEAANRGLEGATRTQAFVAALRRGWLV
jgi:LuxR family quorum sensing-dependent transcriptional regulator